MPTLMLTHAHQLLIIITIIDHAPGRRYRDVRRSFSRGVVVGYLENGVLKLNPKDNEHGAWCWKAWREGALGDWGWGCFEAVCAVCAFCGVHVHYAHHSGTGRPVLSPTHPCHPPTPPRSAMGQPAGVCHQQGGGGADDSTQGGECALCFYTHPHTSASSHYPHLSTLPPPTHTHLSNPTPPQSQPQPPNPQTPTPHPQVKMPRLRRARNGALSRKQLAVLCFSADAAHMLDALKDFCPKGSRVTFVCRWVVCLVLGWGWGVLGAWCLVLGGDGGHWLVFGGRRVSNL